MGLAESQTGWQLEVRAQTISDGNKNKDPNRWKLCKTLGFIWWLQFLSYFTQLLLPVLLQKHLAIMRMILQGLSGHNPFAIIQAEDELSAICMVPGRLGWSSGCHLHLRTRGCPLWQKLLVCHISEIPAVIWNVQRVGPSGLPTRTFAGDLISAYSLSHGMQNLLFSPAWIPG